MPPSIFSSSPTTKAIITLVLIENSQGILPVWNVLRQHYLPALFGSMRIANPVMPIRVLWLTTAPVGDDPTSFHSAPPGQYSQLPELKFSFSPDNRITSRIINRAIELMLEAAMQFHGGPVNFHLFVIAASTPIQGTWGISATMTSQIGQSEWRLLGQRIAQLGIHCHMILPASRDIPSLSELFTTSLELQGRTRVSPWFPTDPDDTFLLSGDPSALDTLIVEPVKQQLPFPVTRLPVFRHQSFLQDVQSAPPAAPVPAQNSSTPSLVSSLQKVHGLSRKKLYGTHPPVARTKQNAMKPPLHMESPEPYSGETADNGYKVHEEPAWVNDDGYDAEESSHPPTQVHPEEFDRATALQTYTQSTHPNPPNIPPTSHCQTAAPSPSLFVSSIGNHDTEEHFPNDVTDQVIRDGHDPVAAGGFADIYRGMLQGNGEFIKVAIKAIKTYSGSDGDFAKKQKRLRREIKVWLNLRHVNVLPLLGTTMKFGRFPAMVCPWAENGPLTSYLKDHYGDLLAVDILGLLNDVACGLQYLHSHSVVHGDLSGSNILILENGRACIADFGLSMLLTELGGSTFATSSHARGTLRWTAPELLVLGVPEDDMEEESLHMPTTQSDVYSFGSVMLQILSGKVPYHYYARDTVVLHAIGNGITPKRPSSALITEHRWMFIQQCWSTVDAARSRPSSEEIVGFTWKELAGAGADAFGI